MFTLALIAGCLVSPGCCAPTQADGVLVSRVRLAVAPARFIATRTVEVQARSIDRRVLRRNYWAGVAESRRGGLFRLAAPVRIRQEPCGEPGCDGGSCELTATE